jgi:hypothetical protein
MIGHLKRVVTLQFTPPVKLAAHFDFLSNMCSLPVNRMGQT